MRKLTLLAATALTVAGLGGQAIPAQAASENIKVLSSGKNYMVVYGGACDFRNVLDKLGNCFPNISLPDCVLPECELPDCELPGCELPDCEQPEVNVPEVEQPEDNTPEIDAPESEAPETNTPGTSTPDNDFTEDTTPEEAPDSEHAFLQEVVNLVNAERAKEGLSALKIDTKVQAAAQVRAKECEQLFSHTRPDGTSFATALKEQNVSYRSAGENIAWGQRSPEEVMNAWMNSSGHRANIMNPDFTTIGVGYYENANGTDYWCQLFTR